MEFIDESSEFKKHHYLRNAVIFILLFALSSFVCAYFSGEFAPVADAFANKILETATRDASFTFFSDYSNFARETVDSAIYFIEVLKESFGESEDQVREIPSVIFTCAASLPVGSENVTSNFGGRTNPITNKEEIHTGIDIAAGYGAPVTAAWPGTVSETGSDEIYGNYIIIRHSKDFFTKYCHLSEVSAAENDFVLAGGEIGKAGDSGWTTGSHLHFEVIVDGRYVDPKECLEIC